MPGTRAVPSPLGDLGDGAGDPPFTAPPHPRGRGVLRGTELGTVGGGGSAESARAEVTASPPQFAAPQVTRSRVPCRAALSSLQPHTPCRVPGREGGSGSSWLPGGTAGTGRTSRPSLSHPSPRHRSYQLTPTAPSHVLPGAPICRAPEPCWQERVNGGAQVIKKVPLPPNPPPHPHPWTGDRRARAQLMFPVTPGPFSLCLTCHPPLSPTWYPRRWRGPALAWGPRAGPSLFYL